VVLDYSSSGLSDPEDELTDPDDVPPIRRVCGRGRRICRSWGGFGFGGPGGLVDAAPYPCHFTIYLDTVGVWQIGTQQRH
jgi:hypothetical protein